MGVEFSKIAGYTSAAGGVALLLGYLNIIKPLRFWARATVYVLLIVVCALLGTVEGLLFSLVGKQGLVQWITARTFYTVCRLFLGYRIEIHDPHNYLGTVRPAVFIANHQSELDILLLGATFPKWTSVTAKKALKWYPFLGWFMAFSKAIFVERARREDPMRAFRTASKEVVQDRQNVFMFPEGTRSRSTTPMLLPFKKGAFHFAQQAQVPIVPYVISNYSRLWNPKQRVSEPGTIRVEVLEPVSTEGLAPADVTQLTESTRQRMLTTLERLGHAPN